MRLTKSKLITELFKLDVLFPGSKSKEEIVAISEQWWDGCRYMSEYNFIESVKLYNKTGKFFPVPADIIELHQTVAARERPKQIEEHYEGLSPEEAQPYIDNIRKILRKNMINNRRRK